ncbi:MAG: RloB domain-containing protein [Muribaculaceae bacterium]|nr:RloB domain-containing protein [Muribaculaceae bacterium]
MENNKSIAIIGEGETEWFYFESLRIALKYPFKIAPAMPQHSDISHMMKLVEEYLSKDYDVVICLIDMDRLLTNKKEFNKYKQIKAKSTDRVIWIETNPCTEFWFLLHFLPELAVKHYTTCEEVIVDLQKYMPGYEKTRKYFRKIKLYEFLRENGDIERAKRYSEQLFKLSQSSPEDNIAYSQIHLVLNLLAEWNASNSQEELKSEFHERIGEVELKIIQFLATSPDSDVKAISRAIGLRQSRTSDYLKSLLASNQIECSEGWRKTYRKK